MRRVICCSFAFILLAAAQCLAASPLSTDDAWGPPVIRAQSPEHGEGLWSPSAELMAFDEYRELADLYQSTQQELDSLKSIVDEGGLFDEHMIPPTCPSVRTNTCVC